MYYSYYHFNLFRRRRSVCRERVTSLALQTKGFDSNETNEVNDGVKPKSQILQNSDFLPKRETSVNSCETEINVNNKIPNTDMLNDKDDTYQKSPINESLHAENKDLSSPDNVHDNEKMDARDTKNTIQSVDEEYTKNESPDSEFKKNLETALTNMHSDYVKSFDNRKESNTNINNPENTNELNTCVHLENMQSHRKEHVE